MRGVVAGLAFALLVALGAPAGAGAASQPPPEPLSPINGQQVEVGPQVGVSLAVRVADANPVYVEVWRTGGSVSTFSAASTANPDLKKATVPGSAFAAGAPESLYSGLSGTVYWRPRSECADEATVQVTTCYGTTQSFVYVLRGYNGLPGSETSVCEEAKAALHAARKKWRMAIRRYKANRNPKDGPRLHREVKKHAAAVRRERHGVARACR